MKRSKAIYWLFLTPCLVTFVMTLIIPMISGFYYSFTDWNGIASAPNFIGFQNYATMFQNSSDFLKSLQYTFFTTLLNTVMVNLAGFGLALLVTRKVHGENLLRSIFFLPNMIGGVLVGFSWQFIFVQVFDKIGNTLNIQWLQNWLSNQATGTAALVIVTVWQMAGYVMLLYIAQLQNISGELIEASKIDGASSWQRIRYLILPLMRPAFTICIFLTLSSCFKQFDLNVSLTNGGPAHSTELLALHIYRVGFTQERLGLAQAEAVIYLMIVAVITLTQLYFSKKQEVEM